MGCCTGEEVPIPEWVKPGAWVVCRKALETSAGTLIEVGSRGVVCHVDEWCAKVIGIDGQYPGLQVAISGPDFLTYWEKAP